MGLSKEFSDLLNLGELNIEYDARSALETLEFIVHSPLTVALTVHEDTANKVVGTIAGIISPWLLNKNARTLQELWFYLQEAHRGPRLARHTMAAFEAYGRKAGATHCIMGTHLRAR
jgi:GNAT superfamily N-acetyltransferase